MTIKSVTEASIAKAAAILKSGECVVIPTETVYGLAADACNGEAVAKIYDIKKRPNFNPLISHFHSLQHILMYVDLNENAQKLAAAFWPGPMTLIVNRRSQCAISDLACAGLDTVAIRIPNHPTAQKIIKAAGIPLAAPSANKSGEISPTSAAHVAESLGADAPLIIADGSSAIGLESTVIDVTGDKAIILRPGAISAEDCENVLGYRPEIDLGAHDTPKSPGQTLKHYAPKTPIRLKAYDAQEGEVLITFGSTKFMDMSKLGQNMVIHLSETGDLYQAASNLFAALRKADNLNASCIAVMDIPNTGIGMAINDRLNRAAEQ
jgi:L-threonylcarbamoyladenylate synthase